ncbi:MAG: Uncharacterised protein [Rhodobiaceae bacterium UBA7378]|nr:MAG: Uncharacterised protein [Rhodobiaceae bacterium UBA7378]
MTHVVFNLTGQTLRWTRGFSACDIIRSETRVKTDLEILLLMCP